MTASLAVTSKGQVTLRKELLAHLGVQPGQRLEVEVLPDGRLELHAARAIGEINAVFGLLEGRTDRRASLELGRPVRITAGTILLVRVLVQDDPEQARAAMDLRRRAELVAVPLPQLIAWLRSRPCWPRGRWSPIARLPGLASGCWRTWASRPSCSDEPAVVGVKFSG